MIDARPNRTPVCLLACALIAGFTITGGGRSALAQQVEGAPTIELATMFIRGVDSAFDPYTNTYLVVGGAGPIVGICVNASGAPISGLFTINSEGFGAFPRARYSPLVLGSGGFLVTWAEETGNPSGIHARTVNCGGAMGAEQVISGGHTAWLESGPAVAYSNSSGRFLVVWKSIFMPNNPIHVKAVLVDTNGAPASGVVNISPGFGRDPGVAWNPTTDQFGVSFSAEAADETSYSGFAIVPASNPAAFSRVTFNFVPGGMTTITDVTYNSATNRFIMSWFELSTGALAKIAEFDSTGNLLTSGTASARVGSYDALSVAFNPASATSLLVGVDRANDAVIGVELNSRGFPFNGENTLSATHRPSFYERVTSSTSSRTWLATFSARLFNGLGSTLVTSFALGGGPPGSYTGGGGGSPAPPPPPSGGCTTPQPGSGWICVDGNWLPPDQAPAPPPPPSGGCTTPQPGSGWICINGNWLPPDQAPAPPPPTSSCTTPQPGAGWVCVNGNWLPPDQAPAPPPPTSSCTSVQPGPSWVCISGNWLPPDLAPAPPPPTSSCTTPQPGPSWVCISGNWLPPDQACVGSPPAPGWVCKGGGWLPPDHPLVTGG